MRRHLPRHSVRWASFSKTNKKQQTIRNDMKYAVIVVLSNQDRAPKVACHASAAQHTEHAQSGSPCVRPCSPCVRLSSASGAKRQPHNAATRFHCPRAGVQAAPGSKRREPCQHVGEICNLEWCSSDRCVGIGAALCTFVRYRCRGGAVLLAARRAIALSHAACLDLCWVPPRYPDY